MLIQSLLKTYAHITAVRNNVRTEKVPDVKPEGGAGSGFDVDVDGWGNEINTDIPIN